MITILTLIDIKDPVRAPTSGAMVGDKTATLTQNIRTVKKLHLSDVFQKKR